MTIRLPFIDRIKVLSQDFINGKSFTLNRPKSYDVVVLPSPTQRGSQQSPLSSVHGIKPGATMAALPVSGKTDRRWSVSQESGRVVEHIAKNLASLRSNCETRLNSEID